jgi:hypothetical protein
MAATDATMETAAGVACDGADMIVGALLVIGGGVLKSTFLLGVHNGSWVTEPYKPCGSRPKKSF